MAKVGKQYGTKYHNIHLFRDMHGTKMKCSSPVGDSAARL